MEFLEDKKELVYTAIGIAIFTILLLTVIFSFRFMVEQINAALNPSLIKTPEAVKFNLDLVEGLRE